MQNKTIDSVLERGTKLDDLVGKSNDLSDHILLRWSRWWLTGRVEDVLQAGEKDELMLYDYVSFCFWCLFLSHFRDCRYGNVDRGEDGR